jgi:hypothetical protein
MKTITIEKVFSGFAPSAAGRHLGSAMRDRKNALSHALQEFILELLAAIVLIAILIVATEPAIAVDENSRRTQGQFKTVARTARRPYGTLHP